MKKNVKFDFQKKHLKCLHILDPLLPFMKNGCLRCLFMGLNE